jgi:hypothetical protein
MQLSELQSGDLINVSVTNDGVAGWSIDLIIIENIKFSLYKILNLKSGKIEEFWLRGDDPCMKIKKIA